MPARIAEDRRERGSARRDADAMARLALFGALAAAALWIASRALPALVLVYASAVVAAGLSPLVGWISERQFPGTSYRPSRTVSALSIYATGLAVLAALLVAVVPALLDQARQFGEALPGYVDRAQSALVARGFLDQAIPAEQMIERIPAGAAIGALTGTAWGVAGVAGAIVAVAFLTFYLLVEGAGLFRAAIGRLSASRRERAAAIGAKVVQRISAWLIGQLTLCGIAGTVVAVVLGSLGVPYFYVLALLNAVADFVPYVGPVVAGVPAILLAATESSALAITVALFYVILYQIEGNVLVPMLMERKVGLPASVVLIAVLVGGVLLGVVGVLLAVPTAAILAVLIEELAPPARKHGDT